MREQLRRFQEALPAAELDGAVIAAPEELSSTNLRYLSGFTGSSAYLLISPDQAWLLTDFRYLDQAAAESPDYQVVRHASPMTATLAELCRESRMGRLGFETEKVPHGLWLQWDEQVPVVWRPLDRLVEKLRLVKTPDEIAAIRAAARAAGESLLELLPSLAGRRESDVALDLEIGMRRRGAESLGFPTIVGAGERGALPHAHPTSRLIGPGELVTIDFGGQVDGYKSDETVTVAIGDPSAQLREIWEVVAEAQRRGMAAVKPGTTSRDVDSAAREYIAAQGFGEYFGHGTGHGVGLDVHEDPFASPRVGAETVLVAGMTITVEPGIYIPGVGGARLEDTLLVTTEGAERLTIVPKHFQSY